MDKLKILVVDDESRMRKLVRDFLVKRSARAVHLFLRRSGPRAY